MPLPPPIALRLTTLPSQPCNYLPGQIATTRAFLIEQLSPEIYDRFMNAGFRRSGNIIYQPVCGACEACVPIRVRVQAFEPNKSQRRCWRSNEDLIVTEGSPDLTDEKFDLYRRYLIDWHGREGVVADDRAGLKEFLYRSPVNTLEFCYRAPEGKLLGVGIADVSSQIFSSVYFYFDPRERKRGLGTFSTLYEIQWSRRRNIGFYYQGFWVNGCRAMQYKSLFRPAETLGSDGAWRLSVEAKPRIQ
jgi:leucyl-tRNA---protein transferase